MSELDNLENEGLSPLTLDHDSDANMYDLVPYFGRSYSVTHPEHLYSLARMAGFKPVAMEKMRVMDIGCAIGGNILPIAARHPKSECVGIEPAGKQMAMAEKTAAEMGIKNCRFYNVAADGIPADIGKFDYIICHGVFSWISEEACNSIMRVCQNHLSENGLAVISYNCRPGWNFLGTMRDAAVFHARNIRDHMLQVHQFRQFVHFIADNASSNKTYADYFRSQADTLHQRADYYLFHEHLESDNKPLYFTQFMDYAHRHDLRYLRETSDNHDFDLSGFKPDAQKFLATVSDNVERGQYVDYLLNRQFRSTILCLKDAQADPEVRQKAFAELYYRPIYQLEKKTEEGKETVTCRSGGFSFTVQNERLEALLAALLGSKEKALTIEEWLNEATTNHAAKAGDAAGLREFLMQQLPFFVNKGFLRFWPHKPEAINYIADKPKILDFALHSVKDKQAEPTCSYFGDSIGAFAKQISILVPYLDGNHDLPQLQEILQKEILAGELLLPDKLVAQLLGQFSEGAEIPRYSRFERISLVNRMNAEQVGNIARQVLDSSLQTLRAQNLLVR